MQSYQKYFITGANGWLGTTLIDNLIQGCSGFAELPKVSVQNIFVLIRPGESTELLKKKYPELNVLTGDISNKSDMDHFLQNSQDALVIHTAGVIHPHRVKDFYRINVEGTLNVMESAVKGGAKKVVVISSNSPNGVNTNEHPLFTEDSPYRPYMNYGRSKMMMEKAVKRIQDQGKLETVIIRAPWFYGPNQPVRQTLFFTMIRKGKMPIVGSGENRRSMVYVDNLCQGILRAGHSATASGQVYWIADSQPYTMNEIVKTVKNVLNKDFHFATSDRCLKIPSVVSELALITDWSLQSLGLYHQKIHVLSEMNKSIACSIEKSSRELGYQPQVALEEGMRRSIKWCLDNQITL